MSTIYAAVNSVNTYRTPKTNLPLDVNLTKGETALLLNLERTYETASFSPVKLTAMFDIHKTTNEGIHHFCVERNLNLKALAKNSNISPMVAFLIHNKIAATKPVDQLVIFNALMSNAVVFSNVNLFNVIFKTAFENFSEGKNKETAFALLKALTIILPHVNAGVFITLLPEVGNLENSELNEKYYKLANERKEDIVKFVRDNVPDLADLPFSWILRVYGIKE